MMRLSVVQCILLAVCLSGASAHAANVKAVDLSGDTARQVVVAAGTEAVYNGHPTTAMLDDGRTVFCFWPTGHGGYAGNAALSTDAGLTWTRIDDRLPEGAKLNVECPLIHRLVGPDGKSRLWVWSGFRAKSLAESMAPTGTEGRKAAARVGDPMPALLSEDDGKTWKEMPPLGPKFRCILSFQAVVRLKDGSYLGIYHRGPEACIDHPPLELMGAVTRDGGFTWSDPVIVAKVEGLNLCEPWAFRSPDGKEICVLIRENHWLAPSKVIFSRDEGKTWTVPRDVPPGLSGHRHQGVVLPDGRVVVCMRDVEKGSPTVGHFVAWVGSYESIRTGKASLGDYRVKLLHSHAGSDCGYPGVHLLKDGTIVATTYVKYRPDACRQSIVSVRFKIAETDALADVPPLSTPGAIARRRITALMEGVPDGLDGSLLKGDLYRAYKAFDWRTTPNPRPVPGEWSYSDSTGTVRFARWQLSNSYLVNAVWSEVPRRLTLRFATDKPEFSDLFAQKLEAKRLDWGVYELEVGQDPVYVTKARLLGPLTTSLVTDFRARGRHDFDHRCPGGKGFNRDTGIWKPDFAASELPFLWHDRPVPGVPERFRLPYEVLSGGAGVRVGLELSMGGGLYQGYVDPDGSAEPPPSPRWKVVRGGNKAGRSYPMRIIRYLAAASESKATNVVVKLGRFETDTRLIDGATSFDARLDSTTGPLPRKLTAEIAHAGVAVCEGVLRIRMTSWERTDLGRVDLPVRLTPGERRIVTVDLPQPDVSALNYCGYDVMLTDAEGRRLARQDWQMSWVREMSPYLDSTPRPESCWGMNCCFNRSYWGAGQKEGDRRYERRAALAAGAGIKWSRGGTHWTDTEKSPGVFDWTAADKTVDTCSRYGITLIGSIGSSWPAWVKEKWTGSGLVAYTNMLTKAATRYRDRIRVWEIWNEPNIYFWEGTDADYFKLLAMSIEALRSVDPGLRAAGCSTAGVDIPYLAAAVTNVPAFQDFALHPYTSNSNEERLLANVRKVDALKPGGKQWLTEMGGYTGCGGEYTTERTQGVLILRQYLAYAASGLVGATFLYDLVNDGDEQEYKEKNFGILRQDFSPKPGYRALALLGRTFVSGTITHQEKVLPDGHRLHLYRQGTAKILLTDSPTRVRVPWSPKDGDAVNLMDEPLQPQEDASGRWLELDDLTPIVFRRGEKKES